MAIGRRARCAANDWRAGWRSTARRRRRSARDPDLRLLAAPATELRQHRGDSMHRAVRQCRPSTRAMSFRFALADNAPADARLDRPDWPASSRTRRANDCATPEQPVADTGSKIAARRSQFRESLRSTKQQPARQALNLRLLQARPRVVYRTVTASKGGSNCVLPVVDQEDGPDHAERRSIRNR